MVADPERKRLMSTDFEAIVVGGGIVGCGLLFALAQRGLSDTVLLEKGELTSGSTWHAAGNCTHFGHDAEITRLYVNSIRTYQDAEDESGQSIGFHQTGSLRLASTTHELAAYEALEAYYATLDVPYSVVKPAEISELHPLLNLEGVLGAAHTAGDGHVDPNGATNAMAQAARSRGATILRHHVVDAIEPNAGGSWSVHSNGSVFTSSIVIVATSFWAREMVEPLGIDLPVYALEHHEIVTDEISQVSQRTFELPTVRDPLIPGNIRQEGKGLLIGIYEDQPVPWHTNGIPPEFGQELLEPNLDRLSESFDRCVWRFPALGDAGIKIANNGPICYAPDGFPILGPAPGCDGLWFATGFHVGIGTGGGAAQYLAEWIAGGSPPYKLDVALPSRFAEPIPTETAVQMMLNHYSAGYATPDPALVR